MSGHKFQFGKGSGGSALSIKVTPRARKNEIVGVMADGTLKIRVTAPPVGGKANEAVIELLADVLNVPRSKIEIVAGETGTQKLVSISDVTPAQVEEMLRSVAREDGED
jgi:uncharacterized protein (TIGR00251 family)